MTGHTSWGEATAERRRSMTAAELEAHDAAVAAEKAAALAEIEAFDADASVRVEVQARAPGHVPRDELLARLHGILGTGAQVTITNPSTESYAMVIVAVMIGTTGEHRSKELELTRGREVADKVRVEVEQAGGEFVAETIHVPAA